jgi:hypothetical protein
MKIKRLSFNVNGREKNMDSYITDEIEDRLREEEIEIQFVLNIVEREIDGLFKIVIYYKGN